MPEAQASRSSPAASSRPWVPPTGPLGELTAASRARAARSLERLPALEATVRGLPALSAGVATFESALRGGAGRAVSVIAEIKRRSPSKGAINESIVAPSRAMHYVEGGASALSVLTEPDRFGGALEDLVDVHAAVPVPLLRKDFITHRVQLLEARAAGASAALLIARALPPSLLLELAAAAESMGLGVLIEVRDEEELATASSVDGAVIGVNNRDLETLVIQPHVGARVLPLIPRDRVAVYESGVASVDDVVRAAALGADAVLVGSILSHATDAVSAVRALCGIPRTTRG